MKKCPKCHAQIEENARFCLYCMTPFEEKEKIEFNDKKKGWWIYAISALLVLAVIVSAIFIFKGSNAPAVSSGASTNINTFYNSSGDVSFHNESQRSDSSGEQSSKNDSIISNQSAFSDPSSSKNSSDKAISSNSSKNGTSSKSNTSSTASRPNESSSASSTTSSKPVTVVPSFDYIAATNQNTFPEGEGMLYPLENMVVITKVKYTEPSGNYVIPETIDGKKVTAIMPSAFSEVGNSLKSVTLPSTVRSVWNDAFKGCCNLKDIYIKSNVICIYTDAFPEKEKRNNTLTIHCKRDCHDFDYYYYRNITDKYDAKYQEWNG